jgi:ATP-binding cassette subfamily C protein
MTKANLQTLQQSLHGVRDIVVLGRESTFVEAYRRDRYDLARARYLRATAAQVPRVGIETGVLILIAVFVGLAAFTQDSIAQTLPLLGLFGYAAARLMPELQHITQGLNALKFVGPAVDDVDADFQVFARERRNDGAPVEPLRFSQALTFTGVSYRYPGADHDALSDVDLKVRPGQSLGLVGPTGGGKSTLVDVLLGLLEPTKGQVCVDSISVHAHPRAWQANLGVVPQTVFLADDTIRSNIALGVPEDEVNTEALREAVSMAQLDEFVSSLPNGLNTVVGERGVRVSGGQRQRLAIARALYRRPSVLVFDEGTSALDNDTELALMDALARLRGQCTLITVAHRLSTVDECDTVLLMRGGCIADRGRLVDLAARHLELQTASTVSDGS